MRVMLQFLIGLIFGLGLVISGMSDPAKVLNFLDIGAIGTGQWDGSLAFVLMGAIAVTFLGYKAVLKRPKPVFEGAFHLPDTTRLETRLFVGAAIFGIGWGLAGLCPGPAFTALGITPLPALIFLVMMFIGMAAARVLAHYQAAQTKRITTAGEA